MYRAVSIAFTKDIEHHLMHEMPKLRQRGLKFALWVEASREPLTFFRKPILGGIATRVAFGNSR